MSPELDLQKNENVKLDFEFESARQAVLEFIHDTKSEQLHRPGLRLKSAGQWHSRNVSSLMLFLEEPRKLYINAYICFARVIELSSQQPTEDLEKQTQFQARIH